MSLKDTIHASAVVVGECGILIRGASGAGKSSLALDLLSVNLTGARLVADDRVILIAANGRLLADVPAEIAGLIEVRGVGIVSLPHIAPVVVRLVVDLIPAEGCPRLPESDEATVALEGVILPRLAVPVGIAGGAARALAAMSMRAR